MLDIFRDDAFRLVPLTDAINSIKFRAGRIGQLGIFRETSVAATNIAIEEKGGLLSLISPTGRGGAGTTQDKIKRTLRSFAVPHFQIDDAIMAEEVQGVRAWGTESQLETVMQKVMERMELHGQSLENTLEHARLGAIKGVVTYADSSELNLYTQFSVDQIAERDWDLDNASPTAGVLRKTCAAVVRQIAGVLDGVPFSGVHAFCGDNFFDDLLAHTEVRASYTSTDMARVLRDGYVTPEGNTIYGAFEFGGIVWENYRGGSSGTWVNTDKCHIFPTGVPDLFRTYFAPADYNETVNTLGQRMYFKQIPMSNDKGTQIEVQMNALSLCTRPRVLLQGRRT